jgi:hypothetical protein
MPGNYHSAKAVEVKDKKLSEVIFQQAEGVVVPLPQQMHTVICQKLL